MTNKERKALKDKARMNVFLQWLCFSLFGGFWVFQVLSFMSLFSSTPFNETAAMMLASWMSLIGGFLMLWCMFSDKGEEA